MEICVVVTAIICNVPSCPRCDPLSLRVAYVATPLGCVETFDTKIQSRYRIALSEDTLLPFLSLSIYRDRPENFGIYAYV